VYFSAQYAFLPAVGGVLNGVGAGLFWTAQGALMMAYGTPQSRGRLIGLFWIIFNSGGVVGGLVQLGLNYSNEAGSANTASYFSFIALMLVGALLLPCLLARPSHVVREDGTSVAFEQARSPKEELVAAVEAFRDPFVWRNLLFWFASNWFYTYDFNGFNGSQFNVRTRGLNSALFWAAQMLAAWLFGGVLDGPQTPARRAMLGMTLNVIALVVSLVPAILLNYTSNCSGGHGFDKDSPCSLDFLSDFQTSVVPMIVFSLLGASDAMYQNYAYWLMSTAAGGNIRKLVQYSAAYKCTQSLGGGIAWLSDLGSGFPYQLQ
jgi:MFS family permease